MKTLEQQWLTLASQWRPARNEAREGRVEKSAPSNIALVKYWGKKEGQIPLNPSLSMTLDQARTDTELRYRFEPGRHGNSHPEQWDSFEPGERDRYVPAACCGLDAGPHGPGLDFRFEGKPAPQFAQGIQTYLERLAPFLPFLTHSSLVIDSTNSFPHSTGIASSASSMAALSLCLLEMAREIAPDLVFDDLPRQASFLARLGSGSACRSLYPGMALWGATPALPGSSDLYAVPLEGVHREFAGMRDSILMVDSGPKALSSSAGHALMQGHPFASARYRQAEENLQRLLGILLAGDWSGFVEVVEEEALSLHAMILTARPGTLLIKPGTVAVLQRVREFRQETSCRVAWTLDAGANVHLLYPPGVEEQVRGFIASELAPWLDQGRVIHDRMGEYTDMSDSLLRSRESGPIGHGPTSFDGSET